MEHGQVNALGIVGLGRMGGGLARQALEKGMRIVGHTIGGASADLRKAGLVECAGLADFHHLLEAPRCILLYVPAGTAVDAILDEIGEFLGPSDVVADGGNSYWGDSVRRHRRMRDRERRFVDVGTSGGVSGARHGACFMVGGEKDAVAVIEPLLRRLAVEGGYVHAGPPGAGHFVKLVHNGIEFGMMQAIAEGVDLLGHYPAPLDIAGTLAC